MSDRGQMTNQGLRPISEDADRRNVRAWQPNDLLACCIGQSRVFGTNKCPFVYEHADVGMSMLNDVTRFKPARFLRRGGAFAQSLGPAVHIADGDAVPHWR
jgi:hypothetical protein